MVSICFTVMLQHNNVLLNLIIYVYTQKKVAYDSSRKEEVKLFGKKRNRQ